MTERRTSAKEPEFFDPGDVDIKHGLLLQDKKALDYLKRERGLTKNDIIKFKLGLEPKKRAIVVPIFNLGGEILTVRFHSLFYRKAKWGMIGQPIGQILYSYQHFDQQAAEIYLTEGEADLWTLNRMGFNAISSICGAPSLHYVIEAKIDIFKGKAIFIGLDNDEPGLEAAARVRELFSDDTKVYRIDWPKGTAKKYDVSDYFIKDKGKVADFKKLFIPFSRLDAENVIKQIDAYRGRIPDNPIYIEFNEYWKDEKKRGNKRLSSFIIKPKERILDEVSNESIKVDLVAQNKIIEGVVLKKDDFNSKQKFLKSLPSTEMSFWGSDNDVQLVMEFLGRRDLVERSGTPLIGLHPSMRWVFPNVVFNHAGIESNSRIVFLPSGSILEDKLDFVYTSDDDYKKLAKEIFPKLFKVNEPRVIFPILGWMFASFIKPLYKKGAGKNFPILNIYGSAEGGKTATARLFYRLLGFKSNELFSIKMSKFALIRLLDSTNSFPIMVDEFKWDQSEETLSLWRSIARSVYGGEIDLRGSADMTLRQYIYRAPLVIIGEVALAREKALVERVISSCPNPIWLNSAEGSASRKIFNDLDKLPLEAFIPKFCPWLLINYQRILERVPKLHQELKSFLGSQRVSLRIYENLIIILMGLEACKCFCETFDVPLGDFDKKKEKAFKWLLYEFSQSQIMKRTKMSFDYMMEQISLMAQMGRAKKGVHFEIEDPKYLFIHFPACFAEFRKFARETNLQEEILDTSAYRRQIREIFHNREYIIELNTVKHFRDAGYKKCIKIDAFKAIEIGLEIEGFGLDIPTELFANPEVLPEPSSEEQNEQEFNNMLDNF